MIAQQFGYLGEGVRTVFAWVGTLATSLCALVAWASRRVWEALLGERARQPLGMVLAGASLFVFVALLDYRAGAPEENLCGTLGFLIADAILRFVGAAAFVAPAFGAFWGIARVFKEPAGDTHAAWKLVGVVVLTGAAALSLFGVAPDRLTNPGFPEGLGGQLGAQGFPPLLDGLGAFGVSVVLSMLVILSLLLATEWAFVPLIKELIAKGREGLVQRDLPLEPRRQKAAEALEEAGRNRTAMARGFARAWQSVRSLFEPFHPGEASGAQPAAAGAGGATLPMNLSTATAEAPPASGRRARGKAAVAEPVAEPEEEEEWEEEEEDLDGEEEDCYDEDAEYEEDEEEEEEEDEDGEWAEGDEGDEEEEEEDEEFSLPGISTSPTPAAKAEPKRKRPRRQPTLGSLPSVEILRHGGTQDRGAMQKEIDALGQRLQGCFDAFGLDARVVGAERGPTLTLFEVKLAAGVSVKKLKNQRDDLAVQLGSHGVRIVYPLPGRTTVGIEVPNLKRENVFLRDVYEESDTSFERNKLPSVLGRDTLGKPAVEDLTAMPHMLVAGTTGSGKSVCLNSMLVSMLLTRTPEQLRLVLIDPKQVELQLYKDIPHLLCPVVTDMKRAPFTLEWATRCMEDRLHMFKMAGVRNITDYNELGQRELKNRVGEDYDSEEFPATIPFIVLVIDELADLMMVSAKEVEIAISRLAAKARAAGIHLLVATQRPSTDVVTGLIKMNLPVRMAFKVTSAVDSRVILDDGGADLLLGNGDFLYRPPGASGMVRGQGAFVSEKEVREVCDHLRAHGKPEFLEDLVQMKGSTASESAVDDPLFEDAVRIILQSGRGSASLLQRALSIGYTRASRLIDIMTEQGVLGPFVGSKSREVLLTLEEFEESLKQG